MKIKMLCCILFPVTILYYPLVFSVEPIPKAEPDGCFILLQDIIARKNPGRGLVKQTRSRDSPSQGFI